ncbi:hypothetical protein CTI12_AA375980 [Artemisia annua]|uniref:Uncharacterized protein n=1 Tax=Artemisia annua TaxID=35608 RepID=A0A2U1MIR9_ARTAN|nr:hypothetical protein CTI12_AA375980 [Artemisia annua]
MSSRSGSAAPAPAPRGDMNLQLKMKNPSKVAKVLLGVLETVEGAYECIFNEQDHTLTITANLDQDKVDESLIKNLKHLQMETLSFQATVDPRGV